MIEGAEDFSLTIATPGGVVASQLTAAAPTTVTTTINDNDTADWVLAQSAAQTSSGVNEGASAIYTLTLDGSASGAPGAAAVQSGDTATINLSLTNVDTLAGDFGETLGAAVSAAVTAFNGTATAGAPGTFSYAAGVVTFTGDGTQTAPQLTIDLDTSNDNLAEGAESFSLTIASPGGDVASQLSTSAPTTVTTTINDNDLATFSIVSDINTVAEGDDVCLLYTSPSPRDRG